MTKEVTNLSIEQATAMLFESIQLNQKEQIMKKNKFGVKSDPIKEEDK
jgi:hypothetical protein